MSFVAIETYEEDLALFTSFAGGMESKNLTKEITKKKILLN